MAGRPLRPHWIAECHGRQHPRLLTVAVTSRALFDLEEGHALFEAEGVDAYAEYQRKHEDDVLRPGVAFPVVRKLLALNQGQSPESPRVEVILLSRNSADTGCASSIRSSITAWASSAPPSRLASPPGRT